MRKMLVSVKHAEATEEQQRIKARFVALGNLLLDRLLRVTRAQKGIDMWEPVCSMLAMRLVTARATAFRRRASVLDLIKAFSRLPRSAFDLLQEEWFQLPQMQAWIDFLQCQNRRFKLGQSLGESTGQVPGPLSTE